MRLREGQHLGSFLSLEILQYLGFADDKGQSQLALIQQNYVQQKLVPKRQFPCIDNCQVLGH